MFVQILVRLFTLEVIITSNFLTALWQNCFCSSSVCSLHLPAAQACTNTLLPVAELGKSFSNQKVTLTFVKQPWIFPCFGLLYLLVQNTQWWVHSLQLGADSAVHLMVIFWKKYLQTSYKASRSCCCSENWAAGVKASAWSPLHSLGNFAWWFLNKEVAFKVSGRVYREKWVWRKLYS